MCEVRPDVRREGRVIVRLLKSDQGIFRRRSEAGPPSTTLQIVSLAEMFAFMLYLQHAIPEDGHYECVTDCEYVREGFYKGKYAMCNGWPCMSTVAHDAITGQVLVKEVFVKQGTSAPWRTHSPSVLLYLPM